MDINSLTIGELKSLLALLGASQTGSTSKPPLEAKRVVLVVDRGWIFAGDQSRAANGDVRLDNCVHVFRWESLGFAKMLKEWRSDKVDLRPCDAVEVPDDAVVFRVPVETGWGVK